MATIIPGTRNNWTKKAALGGSTGGRLSSGFICCFGEVAMNYKSKK
jgi:hypothetical protein